MLYGFLNEIEDETTSFVQKVPKISSLNLSIPMTVFLLQQIKTSTNIDLFIDLSMIFFYI